MKTKDLAAAFLQKAQAVRPSAPPVHGLINAFNSLFSVQDLNELENREIERILFEGFEPGVPQEDIEKDTHEVKRLTKELRAIKRQELVLIGERIAAAREVFRKYKDRSFREWMEFTFGSFKTGYNYLSFYDLYLLVPEEIKNRLKEMPAKAVYILASNKAPVEKKIELVKEHSQKTTQTLITVIRETLGSGKKFVRKISNDNIITSLEKGATMLFPERLDAIHRRRLVDLIDHLTDLVEHSKKFLSI
jgi:hypothetical protein